MNVFHFSFFQKKKRAFPILFLGTIVLLLFLSFSASWFFLKNKKKIVRFQNFESADFFNASSREKKIQTKTGFIEGSLEDEKGRAPKKMIVCAQDVLSREKICTEKLLGNAKYASGVGYQLEVPTGNYYVFAQKSYFSSKHIYYSQSAGCSADDCGHKPVVVSVSYGQMIEKIDLNDWEQ